MPTGEPTRPAWRPDVQGLRGLAVLLVVADHVGIGLPGGYVGVDVFFVVSGYVIFGLLQAEMTATGTVDVVRFYARRLRRIVPALAASLVGGLVLAALATNPFDAQPFAARTAMAAAGFVANVFLYRHVGYFDQSADLNPFLHLWSLAVEEQFYLVVPWLMVAVGAAGRGGRDGARRGPLGPVLVGVSVVSAAVALAMTRGWITFGLDAAPRAAYYAMPTRAWELAVGGLVALAAARTVGTVGTGRHPASAGASSARRTAAGTVGAVAVIGGAVVARGGPHFDVVELIAPVVGTALLLWAGIAGSTDAGASPPTRALSWRPLVAVGDVSFAWYLWHWPAIVVANAQFGGATGARVVAAAAALVPAVASTRWIETPLRRGPVIAAVAVRRAVAATLVAVLVAGAVWSGADQTGWGLPQADWYSFTRPRQLGCVLFNRDVADTWSAEGCTWPGGREGTRAGQVVLVVGDETADAAGDALIDAAPELGADVVVRARTGCPFEPVAVVDSPRCDEWRRDTVDLVRRLQPTVIVVAADAPSYVDPASPTAIVGIDSVAEGRRRWATAVASLALDTRRAGIGLVVVGAVPDLGPRFPWPSYSIVAPRPVPPRVSRATVDRRRLGAVAAEAEALAAGAGIDGAPAPVPVHVDPADVLCRATCDAAVPGDDGRAVWSYVGRRQLTSPGAARLTPALVAAVRRVRPTL